MLREFWYKYIELNLNEYPNIGINLEINKLLFFVFAALIAAAVFTSYLQSSLALLVKKLLRSSSLGEENSKALSDLGLDKNRFLKFALTNATGSASLIIKEAGKTAPTYDDYVNAVREEKERKLDLKKAKAAKRKAERSSIFSDLKKLDYMNSDAPIAEEATEKIEEPVMDEPSLPMVSSKDLLRKQKPNFDTARFYIPKDMEERAHRYYNAKQGSVLKTVLACLGIFAFYIVLVMLMPSALSALNVFLRG